MLALAGGITVKPRQGRTILFGRNRPEVHVCVGEDDPKVSRHHNLLIELVRSTTLLPPDLAVLDDPSGQRKLVAISQQRDARDWTVAVHGEDAGPRLPRTWQGASWRR